MEDERKTNSTNFMDFIIKISNLNYNITSSIFKKTKFEDSNVEEKFNEFYYPKNRNNRIICDIMMLIAYLGSLFFNISYELSEAIISTIICSVVSLFFIIFSYTFGNIKYRKISDYLSVLFFCFEGLSKGVIIYLRSTTPQNNNYIEEELNLRILFFHSIAFNLYVLLKLEAYMFFTIFYSIMNLAIVILSLKTSERTIIVIFEGLRNILWVFVFYSLRKFLDHLHRSIFSEKLRYESLYNYTFEFISGLNCNKIFMKNDEIVLIDNKIHDFLIEVNNYKNQKIEQFDELNPSRRKDEVGLLFKNDSSNYNRYLNYLVPYNNKFNYNKSKQEIQNLEDENFTQYLKEASQEDLNLKDYLNKLLNEEKDKSLKGIILTLNTFKELGIYQLNYEGNPIKKYFEVYFRFVSKINDNFYYDLLFYDVSEVVLSKITIYKENLIKQKFLAKIAHEFKTPIISIIGLISSMKQFITKELTSNIKGIIEKNKNGDKDFEPINQKLNIIQNLSEYVIILVNDVIEYSKMGESLDIEPNLREINIKNICNFCFEILKCLINCNSLKYERIKPILYFDERLNDRKLLSDEIRMKQVLLNFISNSVKFTKFGKITLSFELDETTETLKIAVSDTGIGIKNEDKEKIFNDFIMLNDGKKNNVQGSGLGLSICRTIAQKVPMRIGFESVYGEGSSFSIAISLHRDDVTSIISEGNNSKIDLSNYTSLELYERQSKSVDHDIIKNVKKPKFKREIDNLDNSEDEHISLKEENIFKINENDNINSKDIKEIKEIISRNEGNSNNNNQIISSMKETILSQIPPKINEEIIVENIELKDSPIDNIKMKKKILIVDDNKFINDSTRVMLSKIICDQKLDNFEIVQLYDGVDIIKHVIDDQRNGCLIKCILTDENMEYINGSEAVKILRNLEKRSIIMNVKIISVSSYDDKSSTEYMKKIGMDLTLKKPVSKFTLLESLKEMNVI